MLVEDISHAGVESKKWHIRLMEDRDEEQFLKFLSQRVTHLPMATRYQWLYCDNPHGRALTWLAIHNETQEIIACTSMFPRKMWVQGEVRLACGAGDAFVDPAFRRQGIATALHQKSIQTMKKVGIQFLYGMPNAKNLGAALKAGGINPGSLKSMYLPLRRGDRLVDGLGRGDGVSSVLSSLFGRVSLMLKGHNLGMYWPLDGKLKKIAGFDSRFDKLMEEIGCGQQIVGLRDSDYLDWRYLQNPAKAHTVLAYEDEGRLRGFVALEFAPRECYLTDIYAGNDADSISHLIAGVIQIAVRKNCNVIVPMISPTGLVAEQLVNWGFKIGLETSSLVILPAASDDLQHLSDIDDWYISYADHDVEAITLIQ